MRKGRDFFPFDSFLTLSFSSQLIVFVNHLASSFLPHSRSHLLFGSPPCFDFSPTLPDFMDPPPTGLLAGSTAPPPREAVFNPYRLPVSPPPGNIRPQPHRQPELLWLHWMICLAAWTTEALCAHPMMSQEVPPDQHFETISAPATFTFRHVVLFTNSTFFNVGLREEFLFSNMSYFLRTQPPPLVFIASIPMASFAPWAPQRTILPCAPLPMRHFFHDDNHIAFMTPIHLRNHLQRPPLQLHRHLSPHLHLLAHALAHHHPIPPTYYMILPHLLLPRGQPLPAALLPPLSR